MQAMLLMGCSTFVAESFRRQNQCEAEEFPKNADHITKACDCGKTHVLGFKSYKQNKIDPPRGDVGQNQSNAPMEDTFNTVQLQSKFGGMYFAVFDGHSGWQVANNCARKLHTYIEE